MSEETIIKIESVIDYIETHLNEKLTLDTIAAAIHYSKYHLSRLFVDTVGLHINEYIKRRQLTEAAKLLIFSEKPIIDIALLCGYQSQQAFSSAFKSMYKAPPAEYRATHSFYPLQLRFTLEKNYSHPLFSIDHIRLANETDIPAWMNLMHLVIDGYPEMNEEDYLTQLKIGISEQRALVLKDDAYSLVPCSLTAIQEALTTGACIPNTATQVFTNSLLTPSYTPICPIKTSV